MVSVGTGADRRQVEALERAVDILVAAAAVEVEAQQAQDQRARPRRAGSSSCRSACRGTTVPLRPRVPASASRGLRPGFGRRRRSGLRRRRLRAPPPIRLGAGAAGVGPAPAAAPAARPRFLRRARRRASSAGRRVPGSAARAGASARRCPSRANRSAIRRVRSAPAPRQPRPRLPAASRASGGRLLAAAGRAPGSILLADFARRLGGRDARDLVRGGTRRIAPARSRLMLPLKASGFARKSAIIVRWIAWRSPPRQRAGDAVERVAARDLVSRTRSTRASPPASRRRRAAVPVGRRGAAAAGCCGIVVGAAIGAGGRAVSGRQHGRRIEQHRVFAQQPAARPVHVDQE